MTIVIDKGIPIPPASNAAGHVRRAKEMEVGDSVFLTSPREVKSLCQAIRNSGFVQVTRKVEGGWRVWKLLARPET